MGAPAQAEALVKCCSEIVSELARAHETRETIDLNVLRYKVSKKHKLHGNPRLVDIIAAVPESLKAALLPKLKAKPIRTASGVCSPRLIATLLSGLTLPFLCLRLQWLQS